MRNYINKMSPHRVSILHLDPCPELRRSELKHQVRVNRAHDTVHFYEIFSSYQLYDHLLSFRLDLWRHEHFPFRRPAHTSEHLLPISFLDGFRQQRHLFITRPYTGSAEFQEAFDLLEVLLKI